MGYDAIRFEDLGDFADELTCSICCGIFGTDPVVTPCAHTFCKECVITWFAQERSCPFCRKSVYKLCKPPLVLSNIIGKLKIKCDFEDKGCKSVVSLDSLKSHIEHCEYRPREGKVWLLARSVKHWFGLNSVSEAVRRETLADYDGETVHEPQRRPLGTSSSVDITHDVMLFLLKLVVMCLLVIFAIISIKTILWTTNLFCYCIRSLWGMTGISALDFFSRASDAFEKMVLAGVSFSSALAAIFLISTFVTLYNY